ncbi:putative BRO1 domain-containing protein BROX [Helianthus annuus]|nr:putative BRO1 domain-containing protein BROX [Helianthus annuus]KAJ0722923.1 putative BRO1 domain-containing protein BROX [Helianthus annuus]
MSKSKDSDMKLIGFGLLDFTRLGNDHRFTHPMDFATRRKKLAKGLYVSLKEFEDISVVDSWFELLSVVHMMAMMTLMEANSKLIPGQTVPSETVESTDDIGSAVDLLVKAAGYLQFCLREILVQIPSHIKMKLPVDLQENVLEATYIQALGQGTEMQLASAVGCKNATLSVKRRLACEQLSYFSQAAAYYYHGLITDKGTEPSRHINAVCCFLAAEEILTESKKACLNFSLTAPITRLPLHGVQ